MADTDTATVITTDTEYTPYTYETQYPVDVSTGSTETRMTGFQKFKLEFERIYRILNLEFANYKDVSAELAIQVYEKMSSYFLTLTQWNALRCPVGTILPFAGSASNIPKGWYECNGQNGTPDLRGRFLEGWSSAGNYIDAGLPNITGGIAVDMVDGCNSGGAFSHSVTSTYHRTGSESGGYTVTFNFNAANSNSIYGGSNTVQPASYTVIYIMRMS